MQTKWKQFYATLEPWQKLLAIVVALVTGFYGVTTWVRKEARDAVSDEKFLATLSGRVRPSCIFNSRGAIEADAGAGEYIEDIRVIPAPQIYGFEVVIKAKRHLAYAPMVSGLDVALFPQTIDRGKMYDWDIVLTPQSTLPAFIQGGQDWDSNKVYRFKLEILH